ncbi:MAG: glycosyl hydrolase family 8 [Chlorobium sp.]
MFILLLFFMAFQLSMVNCCAAPPSPSEIVRGSWEHYRQAFIREGRVVRPGNGNDTVSEGEAYAMLRSVLMDDRKTFDECLAWTEFHLSRKTTHGDRLLAWHYENGQVTDSTAASDADIDYAFSLVLASRTWKDGSYLDLAREVLQSILMHETAEREGRLYLLPWPGAAGALPDTLPQNPSYYAPSHFRTFYEVSGDKRWLELADTGYYLIERLQESFSGAKGCGLVPDWCAVDLQGNIAPLPGKSSIYGWESVRVPLRVAADYQISGDSRALGVLRRFGAFFDREFSRNGRIFSEYACDGRAVGTFENALFYSAAYAALRSSGFQSASAVLGRLRGYVRQDGAQCWYQDRDDYYVNSLAWLVEYHHMKKP